MRLVEQFAFVADPAEAEARVRRQPSCQTHCADRPLVERTQRGLDRDLPVVFPRGFLAGGRHPFLVRLAPGDVDRVGTQTVPHLAPKNEPPGRGELGERTRARVRGDCNRLPTRPPPRFQRSEKRLSWQRRGKDKFCHAYSGTHKTDHPAGILRHSLNTVSHPAYCPGVQDLFGHLISYLLHGSLQRALPVLHAAGVSGVDAARRNPELRGTGADRPGVGLARGEQAARHGRRTTHAPDVLRFFDLLDGDSRHPRPRGFDERLAPRQARAGPAAASNMAECLRARGVRTVNISLDTLDRAAYARITGRDYLPQTLAGIDAARAAGFGPHEIKLNSVLMRGTQRGPVGAADRVCRPQKRAAAFHRVDAGQHDGRVDRGELSARSPRPSGGSRRISAGSSPRRTSARTGRRPTTSCRIPRNASASSAR